MSSFERRTAGLPVAAFACPGPLRDQLNAAILAGVKTSTTSLLADYHHEGEELPRVGHRYQLIGSDDQPIAILEATEVRTVRIGDVDLQHALDEGEGLSSVQEWRDVHEGFWMSPERIADTGAPDLTDDTLVVLERFRLVEIR